MASKLGYKAKVYHGTAGTQAGTLLANVRSVTMNGSKAEADASTRDSDFKLTRGAQKDISFDIELVYDPADAGYDALKASYLNGTAIALLIVDDLKTVVGTEGLDFDAEIFDMSREEPIEGVITVKFTAKPTPSSRAPTWFVGT